MRSGSIQLVHALYEFVSMYMFMSTSMFMSTRSSVLHSLARFYHAASKGLLVLEQDMTSIAA